MLNQVQRLAIATSIFSLFCVPNAWAQVERETTAATGRARASASDRFPEGADSLTEIPRLDELERPATTLEEWYSQSQQVDKAIAQAEVVRVTGVQLNPTPEGLEVTLVTADG